MLQVYKTTSGLLSCAVWSARCCLPRPGKLLPSFPECVVLCEHFFVQENIYLQAGAAA